MKTAKGKAGAAAIVLAIAAALASRWEGVKYQPYRDPIGIWTVCYGHTGPDVKPGRDYTKAECEGLLQQDMAEANRIVRRCIPNAPQGVEAALTDAAYNIGPSVVCGSTLQRKALAGDWAGACAELSRWNRAGGRVFRGLTLRRMDERKVCEAGL